MQDRALESRNDSVFMQEWLATGRLHNQLPISATCNCKCIFCSNEQNPFPICRNLIREVDDVKHQLSLMPAHEETIRMSDSLPGRMQEGEALLHPRLFAILDLVRRKYPFNKLSFTSNGSMLEESFVRQLARYRPVEVNISMHSTQPHLWAHLFGKSEREAGRAIASLPLLQKHRIGMFGTLVVTPTVCGWEDLEATYRYFVDHGARKMILYWPGYTDRTGADVIEQVTCSLTEFSEFAFRMRESFGLRVSIHPDMRSPLDVSVAKIMESTLHGNPRNGWGPYREVLWLTSEATFERFQAELEANAELVPNTHHAYPVKNLTYGGNIVVSGLLMVEDFVTAGRAALAQWPGTELVLVPTRPFDGLNQDLVKVPAHRIGDELSRPVWLVDNGGAIDPLLERTIRKAAPWETAVNQVMTVFADGLSLLSRIDEVLDLVDAYPIHTTAGLLNRPAFGQALEALHRLTGGLRRSRSRTVTPLDDNRVQCSQEWLAADGSLLEVWATLIQRSGSWRLEVLLWHQRPWIGRRW